MPILIDMKKKPGVDAWEGQVYNAKDGQFYSSTIKPVGTDQLEIQGCVLGFLCGGETWTRVAASDSLQPHQQHGQGRAEAGTGAATQDRRTGNDSRRRRRPPGAVNPAPLRKDRRSEAGAPAPADVVGDICLLPDIARFAH